MTREEAMELLNRAIKNERMLSHCYAAEAVMRALARSLGQDEEKWAIAGLLHDLDIEQVDADLSVHTHQTVHILNEHGVDPEIIDAIKMHNEEAWGYETQYAIPSCPRRG